MFNITPPHDLHTEKVLLGSIIIDPNNFVYVDSMLPVGAETFYSNKHQTVYTALANIINAGQSFDINFLYDEVYRLNSNVTRVDLINIYSESVTSQLYERYVDKLIDLYTRRSLIESCKNALHTITEGGELPEIIGSLGNELTALNTHKKQITSSSINSIALDWWENYLNTEGQAVPRVYTGWRDLDKVVALMPGTHTLIGARTSIGKTSFAINLSTNIALQGKRPVLFTMEQTKESVATCYISQIADINRFDAMTNNLSEQQKDKVKRTMKRWGATDVVNMGIYDRAWSAQEIRHKIIIERLSKPVDAVIIDFLHNMKAPRGMNREGHEWLRETSAQLEEIAIELNIPIITLAQLSRRVESRDNKRPILSDIREAGEDNADIVMFIYRDEYYYPDTTSEPGVAEIIVAKNRHGKTSTVKLHFVGYSTAFYDRDEEPLTTERDGWYNKYD